MDDVNDEQCEWWSMWKLNHEQIMWMTNHINNEQINVMMNNSNSERNTIWMVNSVNDELCEEECKRWTKWIKNTNEQCE